MYTIRKSRPEDLPEMQRIYRGARLFMRQNGNPDQWGDSYPEEALLRDDIAKGRSYLCIEDGEIAATFCWYIGDEEAYHRIVNGPGWQNDAPYGVLHRIAAAHRRGGAASFCAEWCLLKHPNLRVDTHRDNLPMQHCLEKNGFTFCGVVYLEDGSERLAYQKLAE